jgi:galactokinase
MKELGYKIGGFDATTTSSVASGSGLSSSAAFEVMVVAIMDALYNGFVIDFKTAAKISQYAENVYFGKPSGLLDQMASAAGGLVTIDFKHDDPEVRAMKYDFAARDYALVVVATGGSHADLTDEYASVPRDMKQVAAALGQSVLRAVDETVFWQELPRLRALTGDKALLRAMHFFQDNNRVAEQAAALREDRFADFLALVKASGLSSWTLLQNVHASQLPAEQPIALGLALSERLLAGRGASRVHGGGFAGTIQSYVPLELADTYLAGMAQLFGSEAPWRLRIRERGTCELQLEP